MGTIYVVVGIIAGIASLVLISMRFHLRNSGKRGLMRALVVLWIVCMLIAAASLAIRMSGIYEPSQFVKTGYWYDVTTGAKLSDTYKMTSRGVGDHPLFTLLVTLYFLISIGLSLAPCRYVARQKTLSMTNKFKKGISIWAMQNLYITLGIISLGIVPVVMAKVYDQQQRSSDS